MNQSMKRCAICVHDKRCEIERDILQGVQYDKISEKFGLSYTCIKDHVARAHIKQELVKRRGDDMSALLEECLAISLQAANAALGDKAYGAVGSIMAGPYKVLERSPGRVEETGLEAMRKEMEARRNVAPTT
jgi:hypothetical protein